jgi:membrane protease YdiL (CAAX protease family)
VVGGLGLAFLLVLAVTGLDWLISIVWGQFNWPRTDNEAFGLVFDFALSPIGAVVIGITAGLGEEVAVRGVLQPRMGIILSNLLFTSLHALQYNWDGLLVVFSVGLILGLVRKASNTTTCAIIHGVYNFSIIMAGVLGLPGFS